ncbi:MAG: 2-hydroxy-3-oxopropionate reductase [Deltaproteobacteria bacterium]|nr:2-hydroxy-3-oxopropionate reductase [Deltaproteobacteria bacterium]
MKIGFIGLGIMGKPMAHNLLKAGYALVVYNRSRGPVLELTAAGAREAGSPREVAEHCGIVVTMLPDSPQVEEVALGKNGLLEAELPPGFILVDMSSIAPLVARKVEQALSAKGGDMLDAPVSGGQPGAIAGTLAIMVGGKPEIFEKVKPLFAVLGNGGTLVGPIGAGNITKLVNQIIVALNIAALSEAFVLGKKAGVNPRLIFEAIRGGLAGSQALNAKMPLMLERKFDPGFRINLHIKDLNNALSTGHDLGAPLPLTSQVMEIMQALKVAGEAGNDHSGLVRFFERLAAVEVTEQDGSPQKP